MVRVELLLVTINLWCYSHAVKITIKLKVLHAAKCNLKYNLGMQ